MHPPRPAALPYWHVRLDQRYQRRPRHNLLHLFQELAGEGEGRARNVVIEFESFEAASSESLKAQAARTYANSFGKDPQFYDFYRAMQSYETTFLDPEGWLLPQ